jgi:hypothetical protein
MPLDLLVKDPVISGGLALFPVFSTSTPAPHYLTGPEADTAKLLSVGELEDGASVPTLIVENRGTDAVLLVEGETLIGAQQNRTLNVSVLVGAGTKLEIPVTCVEAGRWGEEHAMGRSGHHAPTDLRRVKAETVNLARAEGFGAHADQGAVWDRVREYAATLSAPSETAALDDVYEHMSPELDTTIAALSPSPEQCGVVVAVGGTVRGIDLFDKPSTLAAYWDGLVAGYAIDALRAPSGASAVSDAEAFVARVLAATDTPRPAVGLGRDHTLEGSGITGHSLEWKTATVHLAAFVTSADGGRTHPARVIDRNR